MPCWSVGVDAGSSVVGMRGRLCRRTLWRHTANHGPVCTWHCAWRVHASYRLRHHCFLATAAPPCMCGAHAAPSACAPLPALTVTARCCPASCVCLCAPVCLSVCVRALRAALADRPMHCRVRVCRWVGQCDGVSVWRCVGVLPGVVWVRDIGTGWVLLHWCIDEHPDSGGSV